MTYEITGEGYAVAWYQDYQTAAVYGPIPADEIQDWIDNWPDTDDPEFDDCVGYSLSELAVELGETFNRTCAPHDSEGRYLFPVNDPALVGQEDQKTRVFALTAVPANQVGTHDLVTQLVADLVEMHKSTAIDLDLWPTAKSLVNAVTKEWS